MNAGNLEQPETGMSIDDMKALFEIILSNS
jgi:hypothetical protein